MVFYPCLKARGQGLVRRGLTRGRSFCHPDSWLVGRGKVERPPCGMVFVVQEQSLYSGKARSIAGGMEKAEL